MLPIPELNEERRRELTKVAAQYAEVRGGGAQRAPRRMDQIKKAKTDGMSKMTRRFWETDSAGTDR